MLINLAQNRLISRRRFHEHLGELPRVACRAESLNNGGPTARPSRPCDRCQPDDERRRQRASGIDGARTGTFTAGVHIAAWRICVVGIVLALGVPAIAWLEQSTLLLLLIAVVVVAVIAPFFWRRKRSAQHPAAS